MNYKHKLHINDLDTMLENEHYLNYAKEKEKIKEKYDKRLFESKTRVNDKKWFKEEGRKEWKKYLNEINELMFKQNGDFQKFSWDIMSENERLQQERWARGRMVRGVDY